MEAFAVCGIDHTTTTDDDEEHAQVIVDVAVIAADAAVDAPWERCVGETNVGLGLRRVVVGEQHEAHVGVRLLPRGEALVQRPPERAWLGIGIR